MTWSYDPASLGADTAAGKRNEVRLLVADVDVEDQLISDEEIDYLVSKWYPIANTVEYCAAMVADSIANRYAREVSYSADGVSINLAQVVQQYRELARNLILQHKEISLQGAVPDFGGALENELQLGGLKNFSFGTQMHDNVEAGQQDYGSRDTRGLTEEEKLY